MFQRCLWFLESLSGQRSHSVFAIREGPISFHREVPSKRVEARLGPLCWLLSLCLSHLFPVLGCREAVMPYLHRSLRPQPQPVPSDARTIHSSRQSFEQLRQGCLQSGTLFEDADFPATNGSLFYSERPHVPFVWKRPGVSRVWKRKRNRDGG